MGVESRRGHSKWSATESGVHLLCLGAGIGQSVGRGNLGGEDLCDPLEIRKRKTAAALDARKPSIQKCYF